MNRTNYTANVTREGRWWVADVPAISYATQCRRLADMRQQVADLIETVTGAPIPPDDIELNITLPGKAADDWQEVQRLRADAEHAARQAALLSHQTARDLAAQGLSMRDIGTVFGVSYQRAHQLVHGT